MRVKVQSANMAMFDRTEPAIPEIVLTPVRSPDAPKDAPLPFLRMTLHACQSVDAPEVGMEFDLVPVLPELPLNPAP